MVSLTNSSQCERVVEWKDRLDLPRVAQASTGSIWPRQSVPTSRRSTSAGMQHARENVVAAVSVFVRPPGWARQGSERCAETWTRAGIACLPSREQTNGGQRWVSPADMRRNVHFNVAGLSSQAPMNMYVSCETPNSALDKPNALFGPITP
ncbi:hypothetical protein PHYPSEUDO_002623 [Phytophthora pseudosyringae]|uniref:Uncharacterized protein n=1 Tax=Phytophthora pseudosyringae TaxID=221518 RepID=A0A8T1VSV9_9STRA|nr:hypothetical protein PHYPSEUDO_002623 [Phytophthora pseudosyringae]